MVAVGYWEASRRGLGGEVWGYRGTRGGGGGARGFGAIKVHEGGKFGATEAHELCSQGLCKAVHTEGGLWPPHESCYFRGVWGLAPASSKASRLLSEARRRGLGGGGGAYVAIPPTEEAGKELHEHIFGGGGVGADEAHKGGLAHVGGFGTRGGEGRGGWRIRSLAQTRRTKGGVLALTRHTTGESLALTRRTRGGSLALPRRTMGGSLALTRRAPNPICASRNEAGSFSETLQKNVEFAMKCM